tara:strand:- start:1214 stop:1384 length:171 start_codon:yes stop_codon:yes gene_type:complete
MESNQSNDQEYFNFLINLRNSGAINMFGAAPYLADKFNLKNHEAQQVLLRWMASFD